jgi:hypothetical protein
VNPRRTPTSNGVFRLDGGTEDSDLWVERALDDQGDPIIISVWEPSYAERERIYNGENIALVVWGTGHPPVMLVPTDTPLGREA